MEYDPCFGFLHDGKKPGRYSFAWDAIETLRPALATAIFEYAAAQEFERADFMSQDGAVRLSSLVLETLPIKMLVQAVKKIGELL